MLPPQAGTSVNPKASGTGEQPYPRAEGEAVYPQAEPPLTPGMKVFACLLLLLFWPILIPIMLLTGKGLPKF